MTGKTVFEKITDVSDEFLEEAAFIPEAGSVISQRRASGVNGFSRFINSGWGVAMVCCLVAVATIVGMVSWGRMGGPGIELPPGATNHGTDDGTYDWYESDDGTPPDEADTEEPNPTVLSDHFHINYSLTSGQTVYYGNETVVVDIEITNIGEAYTFTGYLYDFYPVVNLSYWGPTGRYGMSSLIEYTYDGDTHLLNHAERLTGDALTDEVLATDTVTITMQTGDVWRGRAIIDVLDTQPEADYDLHIRFEDAFINAKNFVHLIPDLTTDRRFDLSYAFSDGTTSLSAKSGDTFSIRASIINLGEPFIYKGASSGFVPYAELVQSDGDYTIRGMIAHTEDEVEWTIETGHSDGGDYYFTVPADAPEGTYDLILSYGSESRRFKEVLRVTRPNITETRAIELAKEALAEEYGLTDLSDYRIWSYKGSDSYSVTVNLQIQGYSTDEEYRVWMSRKGDIQSVDAYGIGTYACYLPLATAEAVKAAEERLAAQSGDGGGFYLVIDDEGYLCLETEVIRGSGDDHQHYFYIERICGKP